jgi:hypothetical protein
VGQLQIISRSPISYERSQMKRISVKSTNINSIGYESGILEIAFVGGSVYQYLNVPDTVYEELMHAASKGGYFHKYIKDKYQTIKAG